MTITQASKPAQWVWAPGSRLDDLPPISRTDMKGRMDSRSYPGPHPCITAHMQNVILKERYIIWCHEGEQATHVPSTCRNTEAGSNPSCKKEEHKSPHTYRLKLYKNILGLGVDSERQMFEAFNFIILVCA